MKNEANIKRQTKYNPNAERKMQENFSKAFFANIFFKDHFISNFCLISEQANFAKLYFKQRQYPSTDNIKDKSRLSRAISINISFQIRVFLPTYYFKDNFRLKKIRQLSAIYFQ